MRAELLPTNTKQERRIDTDSGPCYRSVPWETRPPRIRCYVRCLRHAACCLTGPSGHGALPFSRYIPLWHDASLMASEPLGEREQKPAGYQAGSKALGLTGREVCAVEGRRESVSWCILHLVVDKPGDSGCMKRGSSQSRWFLGDQVRRREKGVRVRGPEKTQGISTRPRWKSRATFQINIQTEERVACARLCLYIQ